tara:strand:+ start:1928 stop:2212 length:285 start_codon:yes stop_codon:yes gene_type:complete
MSTQEERRVGENVKLRKKLARALESEASIRAERRSLARRVRSYAREVLELEMVINELRGKVTAKDTRITKLAKYEDIIVKMVRRVQKDAGNALE